MTVDFSHLKKLQVSKTRTTRYTFYGIHGEPWIEVVPATESNKPYFNSLLKRSRRQMRRLQSGHVNAATLRENRDEDRVLFPKYVCKAWGNVFDSQGNAVEFTPENCETFLRAIPDDMMEDFRNFAATPWSFREDEEEMDEQEVAELGEG